MMSKHSRVALSLLQRMNLTIRKNTLLQTSLYFSKLSCTSKFNFSSVATSQPGKIPSTTTKTSPPPHPFSKLYPWRTTTELAERLLDSQVYYEDKLLIVNKPYGVSRATDTSKVFSHSHGTAPHTQLSLQDCEEKLKQMLSVDHLDIVICPERWCSGFTAISLCPQVTKRLTRSHDIACHSKTLTNRRHMMLCYGVPSPQYSELQRSATQMVTIPGYSYKLPIISESVTVSKLKRNVIHSFHLEHNTVAGNEEKTASLVEINSSSNKNHCQRVWMAHHLAPLLGDSLYSGRVASLMGNSVRVPQGRARISRIIYPYEFLQKIELTPNNQDILPLFSHSQSVRLPKYLKKMENNNHINSLHDGAAPASKDFRELNIDVPIPEHFEWTLEKLNVHRK